MSLRSGIAGSSARGARESSHAGTRLNRAPRQACNLQRRMFKRAMLVLRACHRLRTSAA